ncbi:MAG: phosphatidylserine decarboxylase family protein [Bacteroidetes bacterium]|nr:phosphatidylserine decarboxylase family protein [Bacteroidota bacterium]
MTIHKEGKTILLSLLIVLTVLLYVVYSLSGPGTIFNVGVTFAAVVFLLVLQFFRNPSVKTEINENHVIAPADGKVVVIEETTESEYLGDKRIQVSIFMSPLNVHVNRNPVSGTVRLMKYHPGKYLVAWHPKSSTENERTTAVIQMKNGVEILFRQIAGAVARRICWYLKEGDQVVQGDEFGFIKFGSRVDIFLPLSAKVTVQPGQKTTGGKTIIATLA